MTTHLRSRKPLLLAVGRGSGMTGYSRVLAAILLRITQSFEVIHFAIDDYGAPPQPAYRILPNLLLGDRFGKKQLPALLEQYRPDIIFLYHDIDFYTVHRKALNCYKEQNPHAAVVLYCPIEWETTLPGNLIPLAEADRTVFFTEFGRNLYLRAIQQEGREDKTSSTVIPHGTGTETFFPLIPSNRAASRQQARAALFPGRPELHNAFLLLNANRNNPRKRIMLTLEIFAEFARNKPNAYLYLHMGMLDRGCDVLTLAQNLGIGSRLLLTTHGADKPVISDRQLNHIYNACDVGINTATGEGWGLVAMEHAATGAAQIVPAHSACLELWTGQGILIPADITNHTLDTAFAVQQLNRLYSQPDYLALVANRCFHHARDPKFSWDRIARQWTDLLAGSIAAG